MKMTLHFTVCAMLCTVGATTGAAQSSSPQQYVTDDFVAGFVARPARLLKSDFLSTLMGTPSEEFPYAAEMEQVAQGIGIDPRQTETVIMLLDKRTILNMAGLPDEAAENSSTVPDRDTIAPETLKNNLKQLGLAMHNFHAVYNTLCDDDGVEKQNKGNLSWRVHLLPFLDQQPLYQRFHLDEPWDSEHNKTLIKDMPKVFASNGVKEPGRTAVHVMTGEGTPFGSDRAPRFRDILDGTSNTLMFAIAAAEKADMWSKPGGLKLQPGAPNQSLGKIGDTFWVALMDGSVRTLPADLDSATFQILVKHQDNQVLNLEDAELKIRRLPSWIVRSTTDIDKARVFASLKPMGIPEESKTDQGTLYTLYPPNSGTSAANAYSITFPDSKTLLAAPSELIHRMLKPGGSGESETVKRLRIGAAQNDVTFVADLQSLQALKQQLAGNLPMAGIIQSVDVLEVALDLSGTSDNLQQLTAEMQNAGAAAQLSALLMGLMQMQKAQVLGAANAPNSPVPPDAVKTLVQLMDSTQISTDGTSVLYHVPKPKDMHSFAEELKPTYQKLTAAVGSARLAAREAQRKNHLRQVGLAFHNYHDVYTAFPRHNGDATGQRTGLSWRVHLLPFLEHAQLYDRFHLDEAWDSDHNKTLIEEMPDVFAVEGVGKPGQTSIHVFTGKRSPFRNEKSGPALRTFTDGTSNTILVVEAAAETAAIWTKPGGLEYNGDNGRQLLGNFGESFLALFADGSVRAIPKRIEDATLDNLIQPDDGNPVGQF